MEIKVILHTAQGDVTTAYPSHMIDEACKLYKQYFEAGHKVSMTSI